MSHFRIGPTFVFAGRLVDAGADSFANPIPSFRFWSGRRNESRSCKSKQASCAKSDAVMALESFVCLQV